jgi:hypothetical protein
MPPNPAPNPPTINAVTPEEKSFLFSLPELQSSRFVGKESRKSQSKVKDPSAAFCSPAATNMSEPLRDAIQHPKRSMVPTSGTSTDQSHIDYDTIYAQPRKRKKEVSTSIRFCDIIGHASVKLRIDELILPLGLPSSISQSILKGIRSIPTSILLHGPPGCGKVSLLKIAFARLRMTFTNTTRIIPLDETGTSHRRRSACCVHPNRSK